MQKELRIAGWARAEQRRKAFAEWRMEALLQVRFIFVMLLFATILVYATNHQVELQTLASKGIHKALKKAAMAEHLKQRALEYEKSIDQIANSNSTTASGN